MTGGVDDEDENLCGGCSEIRENGGGALFNDGGTVTLTDVAFLDDPGGAAPGAAIGNNGTLNMSDVRSLATALRPCLHMAARSPAMRSRSRTTRTAVAITTAARHTWMAAR